MRYDNYPRTAFLAAAFALAVILLAVLLSSSDGDDPAAFAEVSASGTSGAIATDPNLKVAFIGDTANGANFQAVLNLVQSEGADIVMHQGDFDYADNPGGFFATINSVLGPAFPYVASVGNHDAPSWPEGCGDADGCYAALFKQRMAATGITPDDPNLNDEMYSTEFHGLGMFFVGETTAQAGDCPTNPSGYACYLRTKLQTDQHIWRICSWHKDQRAMQVGGKTDEMGWGVYDACTDLSAIIATGHEHSYERTKTMTDPATQTVDLEQHPLNGGVPGNPNSLRVKPGSSFVFVSGLGGFDMRDQERCLPATYPYGCNSEWASIYTTTQTGGAMRFGVLFIEFYVDGDPYKARAYFKTTTGEVIDSFEIWADYQDTDSDGIQDGIDNCTDWPNASQALPAWTVPPGDSDCDGFPDSVAVAPPDALSSEAHVGTDPASHCAADNVRNNEDPPDRWPVDFDDNQVMNGSDLLTFAPTFGKSLGDTGYDGRFDLSNDDKVNGTDLLKTAPFLGKHCA